jgi:amidase
MQGVTEDTNAAGAETELCFATARELVERVRRREISVREVVQAHLDQIERVNPQVNAVVTVTPDRALAEAAAADELLAAGHEPGPLFGLPIAHKDTHLTAGIRTTFGSQSMRDFVPDNDELIVERIRAAGAVTIGKTNVPEFGAGSHTFNTIFGTTRNPYDVARSAGGSSGGAAAALASGMHAIADGSDMGGSLRNPAAFCNVVGLRPSPGRVPSYPSDAAWATMTVQGPMARNVSDTALLLSVIGGPDPRCPISLPEPGNVFGRPLERDLSGLRVAWSPDLGGSVQVDPVVTATLLPQVAMFESLGCVVEEACPDFTGADEVFRTLRAWQFELMLGTLANTDGASFKPSLMWNIEQGRRLTGRDIAAAEIARTALYHRFREFFERYDILLLPVSQVPPFDADVEYPRKIAGIRQDTYLDWMRSAYYVSATGHPALSVPGGFTVDGLPVGLQIVGPHHGDLDVLQVGYAFEQATHFGQRRPVNLTTGVAHD